MKKILILDAQTIQTLPVAKSLKQRGYYVILMCDTKNSYGYHTKYADRKIIAPSIRKDRNKFHNYLMDFIKSEKVDVLIPMFDDSAQYISFYQNEIRKYTKFITQDYDIFMMGYDKNKLMKICQDNGFPHPLTIDLSSVEWDKAAVKMKYPALIKPNISYGARGLTIVNSMAEVKKSLPAVTENYGHCHLQEYIAAGGHQYVVGLFVWSNALINATVEKKIRYYPTKGGTGCFNQTVEKNDLVKLCFNILKKINWEGFAHFDLIEDPNDGIIKIMELNPRIHSCIKSSFSAGVDFIENIVSSALGKQPKKYIYSPGSYLRYLGLDILWFIKANNRFRAKPPWFKELFSSKHFLQDGSFDDPKPFIYGTLGGFLKQLHPRFRAAKKGMN
ncbi:MAG TPA: ATP-grasp domain-containing protein [Smithellaceae bacterium]|nr:ATP-grasp domain-containing protein [Smithellaceae bacterium]